MLLKQELQEEYKITGNKNEKKFMSLSNVNKWLSQKKNLLR